MRERVINPYAIKSALLGLIFFIGASSILAQPQEYASQRGEMLWLDDLGYAYVVDYKNVLNRYSQSERAFTIK